MMKRYFFLLASLTLAISLQAQTKPGDIENGKKLFEKFDCYQCHGWQGQGGLAGARLSQTRLPQAAFLAFVRNPPSGGMPPFRAKIISDQELADIYAYIKTFPEPKAAKDIPLLSGK
jgi:mono/diheme cytochrome c family protein